MSGLQKMASPKRPPIPKATSSASSLATGDLSVPAFPGLPRRTPSPANPDRALPSVPLVLRRASSGSIPRSKSSSSFTGRRSSSVYSRTVSQWGRDDISWHSADFADEPLPPLPTLQPLAYSVSSPQLLEKQTTPIVLDSRAYSPLISTPSPTASQVTAPLDAWEVAAPTHTKLPPVAIQLVQPTQVLHTVPLDKAIAAVHAPGAVHLLPEELRARTAVRSRSHEPLRMAGFDPVASTIPPRLPQPPVLVDQQGRQRSLISPDEPSVALNAYPLPAVPATTRMFHVPANTAAKYRPLPVEDQQTSGKNWEVSSNVVEVDEPRGRTMKRGSRSRESNPYQLSNIATNAKVDAPLTAQQYRALLPEQYRTPSRSTGYGGNESEDSVLSDRKLVPDPLFQSKPPAKAPGGIERIDHEKSVSPYHLSPPREGLEDLRPSSVETTFPSAFTMAQGREHRRTSTSGSIPISPPTSSNVASEHANSPPLSAKAKKRRQDDSARASAYYPHIASRKPKAGKVKTKPLSPIEKIPPMPFLGSNRRKSTSASPKRVPRLKIIPAASMLDDSYDSNIRRRSDASSHQPHLPLHQRFAKGVAKYADLLTRPDDLDDHREYTFITSATISPGSPHLLPSPAGSKAKGVHLGWSDVAKDTFDKVVSPGPLTKRPATKMETPRYAHITTPARPLDESKVGLREGETPVRRKSSIFGAFVDSWRENRAERRREELKKIIRVLPQPKVEGDGGKDVVYRRSYSVGWV